MPTVGLDVFNWCVVILSRPGACGARIELISEFGRNLLWLFPANQDSYKRRTSTDFRFRYRGFISSNWNRIVGRRFSYEMIQIRPKRIGADDGMNETRSVQTILTET